MKIQQSKSGDKNNSKYILSNFTGDNKVMPEMLKAYFESGFDLIYVSAYNYSHALLVLEKSRDSRDIFMQSDIARKVDNMKDFAVISCCNKFNQDQVEELLNTNLQK